LRWPFFMGVKEGQADVLNTRYVSTHIVGKDAWEPVELNGGCCKNISCAAIVFLHAFQLRKVDSMAFENTITEINLLLEQFENQPEDAHELQQLLHEKLSEIRAMGMPLPDDLVELEKRLQEEFLGKNK